MTDLGLLVLRLGAGGMMVMHGIGKAQMLFGGKAAEFGDPIGIGAMPSLVLDTFAELLCALAVAVGFKARLAAIPIVFTMLVAAFVALSGKDFFERELPLLFAVAFTAVALLGSGRHSLDTRLAARSRN